MITYSLKGKRHNLGMNTEDFEIFAEVVFLIRNTPPPVGFNRKPFTLKQQKVIEELFGRLNFSEDFAIYLNKMNHQ